MTRGRTGEKIRATILQSGGIMKSLLAAPILVFLLCALCQAGNGEYTHTKFDDFWRDKTSYVGGKVELDAFGRYVGGILFITKDPGSADFLHINLDDVLENQKIYIQKSCAPNCNVVVRGSVEKDRLGLIVIRGESVSVGNY